MIGFLLNNNQAPIGSSVISTCSPADLFEQRVRNVPIRFNVRGGGRLRDEPKECLRRRLHFIGQTKKFSSKMVRNSPDHIVVLTALTITPAARNLENYYRNRQTANSKTSVADDFGDKRLRFWSRGFACQTKMVNACGDIPVRDLTIAYSVKSKRRTLIRGKSIHESFKGSFLGSIIAEW